MISHGALWRLLLAVASSESGQNQELEERTDRVHDPRQLTEPQCWIFRLCADVQTPAPGSMKETGRERRPAPIRGLSRTALF